ncbi:MAG: hypothetical protein COX19_05115 [Desulfobacterales bacterium CG23_combo_of_CG06-09_8_20_14_all_51_8]|nr:MAG: hypothetical protein COX19_05115 [Desulfobacterales bacterium CG23_combo_of_CG06-09_8_20_14_all_51_8]
MNSKKGQLLWENGLIKRKRNGHQEVEIKAGKAGGLFFEAEAGEEKTRPDFAKKRFVRVRKILKQMRGVFKKGASRFLHSFNH